MGNPSCSLIEVPAGFVAKRSLIFLKASYVPTPSLSQPQPPATAFITLAYMTSYPEKVIKAVAGGCGWVREGVREGEGGDTYGDFKKIRDLLATKPAGTSITEQLGFRIDSTSELSKLVNANDPLAMSGAANGMLQLFNIEENKLKTNKVPTLLLIGEKDDVKDAEMAASVATNMKLQILQGQDHLSAINDSLFLTAIKSFLMEK